MPTGYDTDDLERDFGDFVNLSATLDNFSHGDYRRAKAGCRCPPCRRAHERFMKQARAERKANKEQCQKSSRTRP